MARSGSSSISGFPLRVSAGALQRSGEHLRGSVVVMDVAGFSVAGTEAALVMRQIHHRALEGVGEVGLPGLAAGSRRRVVVSGRIPGGTRAGRYQVLGCIDVGSQLARFDARRNCVIVGSVRISGSGVAKSTTPAPQTTVTGRPPLVSSIRSASFRFSSSVRRSRFRCRLDGGPWLSCTSPQAYARLVVGKHEFEVRAVTRAGHADPSPARAAWRIESAGRGVTSTSTTITAPTTTTSPATPPPATSITVDTASPGPVINPGVFGSDYLAPFGGMGSFDADSGAFWPSFTTQLTSEVGAGSLRFPGGITGQSYQWMRAIGPQSQRGANPVGPSGGPSPSTVGPDEFGSLLDLTGAAGVIDVDFATGTAAEAADFVHYMTDAQGSSTWAQERAQNGHPAPYDAPYWEVGNEELTADYWRSGTTVTAGTPPANANACPTVATCEYIYGGTTSFTDQRVVLAADRRSSAAASTGAANQSFQVAYPPVVPASATVKVGGIAWALVSSLTGAGPSADDYTLDPSTGAIQFGDGVHGAIPPSGAVVTATYQSGPHDGFAQFYNAMKQADPAIQVCSSDTTQNFIDAMGTTQPYDCLQDHPYVGSGNISPSLPIDQYESQVMTVPDVENAAVKTLQADVDEAAGHHVPLILSEYGQLIDSTPDPLEAPYFLNSLDEALVNASQLADWIQLGVPVADRQLLDAELPAPSAVTAGLPGAAPFATSGAITTPGPQTVVQPTGEYLALMEPLAGGSLLDATVSANPALPSTNPAPTGDLATVSAATPGGVRLVVINRSPSVDVASTVDFAGMTGNATATVATLDGPSPLSDNSSQTPNTVSTSTSPAAVTGGAATITFPAHSISLVTLPGS
jgi:alpha-N-arabinofuranosidase